MLLFLLLGAMLSTFSIVAAHCNCNNGNVEEYSPFCICACSPDYLPPRCLFKAADRVKVEVWLNAHISRFSREEFLNLLRQLSGAKATDVIDFIYAEGSHNKTKVLATLPGIRCSTLVTDFENREPWLSTYGIEAVWDEFFVDAAGSIKKGKPITVYESDDRRRSVRLVDVAWLAGCSVLVIALMLGDCIFLDNDEDDILEEMNDERVATSKDRKRPQEAVKNEKNLNQKQYRHDM